MSQLSKETRVFSHCHDFIQVIDLTKIKNQTTQLLSELSPSHCNLSKIKQSLFYIQTKLENFENPKTRQKRGLINIVGSLHKYLFGTLDNDDLEIINSKFNTLLQNEHEIKTQLDLQSSILINLNKKLNDSFLRIDKNFNTLSHVIEKLKNDVECVRIQLNLQEIFTEVEDLLSNLETATNLAQHNIIHNFFLPLKNIKPILNQLYAIYDRKEIIELANLHSYYNLFLISVTILEYKIIVKLSVPLFFPEHYNTYHLLSIPINDRTIIPFQPYLHANLDTEQHLWTAQPCPYIEEYNLCKGTFELQHDQCFLSLIQNKPHQCPSTNVKLQATLLEQLKDNQILIIPHHEELVHEQCHVKQTYSINQPSVVTIDSCDVIIRDVRFSPRSDYVQQTQVHLPTINLEPSSDPTIHLHEMDLQDFQQLQRLTKSLKPVHLSDFENMKSRNVILYIFLFVIIVFCTLLLYYRCLHKKLHICHKKNPSAPSAAAGIPLREGIVV